MKKHNTQLIVTEPQAISPVQDEATALISQAINKGVDVDTMEKLLAMRRELKAEKAKEAFDQAMAAFQADCPTIKKTKEVRDRNNKLLYSYAPIESIVEQVKDSLKNNGFSYSTNMELLEDGVKVCVKVTHAGGHSETTCMTVPLGQQTQVMSRTQVVASAQTFAKRYAFCNAFGILTGDEDTDARPAEEQKSATTHPSEPESTPINDGITPLQIKKVFAVLNNKGKTKAALDKLIKKAFNKDSLSKLSKLEAEKVIGIIEALPAPAATIVDEEESGENLDMDEITEGIEQQKLQE